IGGVRMNDPPAVVEKEPDRLLDCILQDYLHDTCAAGARIGQAFKGAIIKNEVAANDLRPLQAHARIAGHHTESVCLADSRPDNFNVLAAERQAVMRAPKNSAVFDA